MENQSTENLPETPLAELASVLTEAEFPVVHQTVDEKSPVEQIFVPIALDDDNDLILQVLFVNDLVESMGVTDKESDDEEAEEAQLLQFFIYFPFQAKAEKRADLALFLMAINRLLPIGAFGVGHLEGTVYYQYILTNEDQYVSPLVILELVSMISMFIPEFFSKIASVAEGEETGEAVLEAMAKNGIVIPPLQA